MANLKLIRGLLEEKKITIDQLSGGIGVKKTAIYKMITQNSTTIQTLEKISKFLDVPVSYFFKESDQFSQANEQGVNYKFNHSESTIDLLIKQNTKLVEQVSDLIKMQVLNADTINNLSKKKDEKG